ncbi:sister chromatid cohesion protein PDS5 homolog E-like [Rhododendron vialii]|uniref:sister chromatid cohesion protein PDS5 homolog E-like n=1 Tax=Rhododendron vialii TaxID=182163 RepID=UPI00265E72AF|nr:sister chromatid cohesion protein PDS5 homolog E-like [Rhododendron vialii]XP_058205403.1 sister chromatid cohesion protein PDS5 homolog E-like [Rhododendron vialii]
MARKKVGRLGKSDDVASKMDNRGNRKKGNIAEKVKDSINSGGSERVLRSRRATTKGGANADEKSNGRKPVVDGNSTGGVANADEKAKGKRPMVEGNLNRGGANVAENAEGKKPMVGGNLTINDEVAQKGGGNEKGKRVSGDRDWILKPHNPRQGDKKISEKAKGKRKLLVEEENDEEPVSPAKWRKPDDGIADPNASSAERGAYNMRARKAIPSFQRLGLSETGFALVVGKRVKVYKSGSRKWVTGTINSYNDKKKLHNVLYVDGESKELDLKSQRFEVEVMPGEASTLCTKEKPNVNPKSRKTMKTDSDVRSDDQNVEMEKGYEESYDQNMVISEVAKVSQKKIAAKPRQKLVTNAGKRNAGDGASASKSKPAQKMKKDEEQVNVKKTKNPPRRGRSNSNTKK